MANPWRYTGQYQDTATGLYKMGARYYEPELGRWTQQDPSGLDANAYTYVGGNPVNFVDPSGLGFFDCIGNSILAGTDLVGIVEGAFGVGAGALTGNVQLPGAGAAFSYLNYLAYQEDFKAARASCS